jgi:hypothetical protein
VSSIDRVLTAPVQAAAVPAEAVTPAEDDQPSAREDPRPRRARDRHAQDLEDPRQTALLPAPRHRDRAGHLVLHHVEANRYTG